MLWIFIGILVLLYAFVFALCETASRADREVKEAFREYIKRKARIKELSGKRIPYSIESNGELHD